jgi:hypothetical protein
MRQEFFAERLKPQFRVSHLVALSGANRSALESRTLLQTAGARHCRQRAPDSSSCICFATLLRAVISAVTNGVGR